MIRIAVVDDQHLFRQGLCALIKGVPQFELTVEAENGHILLDALKQLPLLPHIVLIDLNMPGLNGTELNHLLHRDYPTIKVVVLTVHNQDRYVRKMTEAGACGYLIKDCTADELVLAIDTVYRTGFYFNTHVLKALQQSYRKKDTGIRNVNHIPVELTERELEVLKLICTECTNSEIAARLFISTRTVEGHRNNLLIKTGCRNTAGLVIFAIRYGLFDIGF